jgi:hypothetical protein
VQVGGKIAGVGQRLIDSTAKSIIRQGLAALDVQIQARVEAAAAVAVAAPVVASMTAAAVPATEAVAATPATVAVAATPATPSVATPKVMPAGPSAAKIATEVAKDVARDLASDVIPLNQQEKALWFAYGAVAMLVLTLLLRAIF